MRQAPLARVADVNLLQCERRPRRFEKERLRVRTEDRIGTVGNLERKDEEGFRARRRTGDMEVEDLPVLWWNLGEGEEQTRAKEWASNGRFLENMHDIPFHDITPHLRSSGAPDIQEAIV